MDENQVVDLGGGEEYFLKDYDDVHCVHGAYIGYPGGGEFLCPYCEDGEFHLYLRVEFQLTYDDPDGEDKVIAQGYSGGSYNSFRTIEKIYLELQQKVTGKEYPDEPNVYYTWKTFLDWGQEDWEDETSLRLGRFTPSGKFVYSPVGYAYKKELEEWIKL